MDSNPGVCLQRSSQLVNGFHWQRTHLEYIHQCISGSLLAWLCKLLNMLNRDFCRCGCARAGHGRRCSLRRWLPYRSTLLAKPHMPRSISKAQKKHNNDSTNNSSSNNSNNSNNNHSNSSNSANTPLVQSQEYTQSPAWCSRSHVIVLKP